MGVKCPFAHSCERIQCLRGWTGFSEASKNTALLEKDREGNSGHCWTRIPREIITNHHGHGGSRHVIDNEICPNQVILGVCRLSWMITDVCFKYEICITDPSFPFHRFLINYSLSLKISFEALEVQLSGRSLASHILGPAFKLSYSHKNG